MKYDERTIVTACPDWEQRIRDGRPLIPDHLLEPINPELAAQGKGIFGKLRLPDVVDNPPLGDPVNGAGPWFLELVPVFTGAVTPDGKRVIRELWILVPKKNSKTTYAAALMLTALLMNKRPRAEFLLVGPTQATADLSFQQIVGMIEADEEGFLKKRLHVTEHTKTIKDRRTNAKLRVRSFDPKIVTGQKPVGVLIDEMHELAKNAKASKILTQLRGGIMAAPEGFLITITTQSDEPPTGAFKDSLKLARAVRDGTHQAAILPILYEFPTDFQKAEKWRDPATWHLVCPNIGRSIQLDALQAAFEQAKFKGEAEEKIWCSQHLNIEIGVGLGQQNWPGAEFWLGCVDESLSKMESLLDRCEVIVGGIDGGGMDDWLGLCIMGREATTRRWLAWFHAWAHEKVLVRRQSEASKFEQFAKEGDLTIFSEPGQDTNRLGDLIALIEDRRLFPDKHAIGVDAIQIADITDELESRGIDTSLEGERVVGINQGFLLMGAIKTLERRCANKTFLHAGRPMMSYCVGNAKQEPRGNSLIITKQAAGIAKIDPLMAAFNAATLMARNPISGVSIYAEDVMFRF